MRTTVVGYNIVFGSRGYGVFDGKVAALANFQLKEMPVDEAFMVGYGLGRAMAGERVVVWFERLNFLYEAMGELCNHVNVIEKLWGKVDMEVWVVKQTGEELGCQHSVVWADVRAVDELLPEVKLRFGERADGGGVEKLWFAREDVGSIEEWWKETERGG